MKLKSGDNISSYLTEVDSIGKSLGLPDAELREFLLDGGLPENWENWLDSIKDNPKYENWVDLKIKVEKEGIKRGFTGVIKEGKMAMEGRKEKFKRKENFGRKSDKRFEGKCFYCDKVGHKAEDCFLKKKKGQEFDKTDKFAKEVKFSMMVANTGYVADNKVWKYDTACSDHCTPHREMFHTYEVYNDEIFTAKVGVGMKIVGKGTVRFLTEEGYGELANVLHVPDMARNLLSGPTLMSKGIRVSLGTEIAFTRNEKVLIKGKFKDGYWSINFDYGKQASEVVLKGSPNLQHQRFGHLHDKALVENGLIEARGN